jgi:predicted AAA+ superfamily ATPase
MAITNHDRVGKSLEQLRDGLLPFVKRELQAKHGRESQFVVEEILSDTRLGHGKHDSLNDVAVLLIVMDRQWGQTFRWVLGKAERSLVNELIDVRNRWALQEAFSGDDCYRALDSTGRLLEAVSAPQAAEVEKVKAELLRVRFDEQMRTEKRRKTGSVIEASVDVKSKPWREVVIPHKDVASGKYQQAEFAADLWQVHIGEGSKEYRDPVEFFRRTFLTESLKRLLKGGIARMCGEAGDPVVQLQTNFGGGKTHSMLALYHLFSGVSPSDLPGVDQLLAEAGIDSLPVANRVVLVGNKISPGNPSVKEDGTEVRTLWGEMAWQLGGRKAFDRIRKDDEQATSPGDVLRKLFNDYGPCLILIDEWVAYARQLHDQGELPAGNFETQFSFAQALTESAKAVGNCLLVVSLPASDTGGVSSGHVDSAEVGGQRGHEALQRLRNVIGRVESSWRPATAEESFEIVRRRLFEPLIDKDQFVQRDITAREFYDYYRSQKQEFPSECSEAEYEKRLKDAYPIHPEVFDRLYTDWSTLLKFQRTRGVLRLMAAVIHSLWVNDDRNPLILPANIPIDDERVQFELTRYLSDNWVPVIEKDVDGPNSLPRRMDGEVPNLGKHNACRRVARTIYLGSAPISKGSNLGIEDRRIKLGCVLPGESPAVFGDALRRLAGSATYLYQDPPRYWYSTQPTVTKLADDRAADYHRNDDAIASEVETRLRENLRASGDFSRVHLLPGSGQDVLDDLDARLVVLGIEFPHSKDAKSRAIAAAKSILESRGSAPRIFQNTLVFLAADETRLGDLIEAICKFLAWQSILNDKEALNLDPHQVRQAQAQHGQAEAAVRARVPETYQWLLAPAQKTPDSAIEWEAMRQTGQDALAVRASKKLRSDELLITSFAATRLKMELDRIPLWRSDHVQIRQLADDFAKYLYLPRLRDTSVLIGAINEGLALLTWSQDSFAFADSYDEAKQRYRGLRSGSLGLTGDNAGLLVKAEVAVEQVKKEKPEPSPQASIDTDGGTVKPPAVRPGSTIKKAPTRYHGSVELDSMRVGRDAGRIADELISHLAGLEGANVTVTMEIEATVPDGIPETVVRVVTENGNSLKFTTHGFEKE